MPEATHRALALPIQLLLWARMHLWLFEDRDLWFATVDDLWRALETLPLGDHVWVGQPERLQDGTTRFHVWRQDEEHQRMICGAIYLRRPAKEATATRRAYKPLLAYGFDELRR